MRDLPVPQPLELAEDDDLTLALVELEKTLTLEQLGKRFGVTKERVRQIERRALDRLRGLLAPSLADALCD